MVHIKHSLNYVLWFPCLFIFGKTGVMILNVDSGESLKGMQESSVDN